MSAVKERIIGALALMNDSEAEKVWTVIQDNFSVRSKSWDDIEEVEPDEIDLKMLNEIKNNPECKEFIPASQVYKELGIE